MSGCWFLALEAGSWHGRSSSSTSRRQHQHHHHQKQQQQMQLQYSSRNSKNSRSQTSFLVGFQKGRSGLRGTCSCEWFRVIFGTKLGGVLLFRVGFEKNVWLLVSCLGGWFMARQEQQQHQHSRKQQKSSNYSFLVGFQKGRSGLRGPYYCEWFRVIFGTKLGGVLLFRVGFKKMSGCWFLALEAGSWHGRSSSSISRRQHQHHHHQKKQQQMQLQYSSRNSKSSSSRNRRPSSYQQQQHGRPAEVK